MVSDQQASFEFPLASTAGQLLLFETSPTAKLVSDETSGLVLRSNRAARELYGYSESELSRILLSQICPHRWCDGEARHYHKDGGERRVNTVTQSVKWKGRPALLSCMTDRTEAIQAEERLKEALIKAEEALKIKTDFLSTMSHEIRTPLNGVIGMAGILAETELTGEQRDLLGTIRTSGEMLLTIVNDILDYTQIEQRKLRLEIREFDLWEAVEECFEMIALSATKKGLQLSRLLAADVPLRLKGDQGRLKQILLNLLTNAVKFTEAGSVTLRITRPEPGNNNLLFQVIDTGIGIPAEAQERLFERFSQADSSSTRRFGGTGLGLAIARLLLHEMGGRIGVTSVPGQGSTFWFTVNLAVAPPATVAAGAGTLKGQAVLLIQRNEDERANTRKLLETMGLAVTEAGNAPHGLSLCAGRESANQPFNFCLVDLNLPVIDGLKFVRLLRSRQSKNDANRQTKPETRVVLLQATQAAGQFEDANAAGLDDVLFKPLRQKQVMRALVHLLQPALGSDVGPGSGTPIAVAERRIEKPVILVVEDNPINQLVAQNILDRLGYRVQIAADGFAALAAFSQQHFDLILMDCHMPGMDGLTATQKIRALGHEGEQIPIVALTADVFESQRERCLQAGMNDFLTKPIHPEILKDKLDYWLLKKENTHD